METVVDLFNEDFLEHFLTPHVIDIPSLMTHMWRRQLYKDVNVLFPINMGPSFWPCSMHEPLTVLIFFLWIMFQNTEAPGCYGGVLQPLK